jgi:hypothetical protein
LGVESGAWAVLDGRLFRHTHEGVIEERLRRGEEPASFDAVTRTFQTSQVGGRVPHELAIMFSEGKATERGFAVRGQGDVGEAQPEWAGEQETSSLMTIA